MRQYLTSTDLVTSGKLYRISSARKVIGYSLYATVLFPWLSFGLNQFDSQPWQYLFAVFYFIVFFRDIKIPYRLLGYLMATIFGILIGISVNGLKFDFTLARGLAAYLGVFLLYCTLYDFVRRNGIPVKLIALVSLIWVSVALLEYLKWFDPSLVTNARTSLSRGTTSLAAEPTFFGIQLFFLSWILIQPFRSRDMPIPILLILCANILAIFFLARSSMAVVFVVVACVVYYFIQTSLRSLGKGLIIGTAIAAIVIAFWPMLRALDQEAEIRALGLLSLIADIGVTKIFEVDGSFNGRLQDIVLPIAHLIDRYGVPAGFHSYGEYEAIAANKHFGGFFWYQPGGNSIMSYFGAYVAELGLLGLVALILLFFTTPNKINKWQRYDLVLLSILLWSSVPVANAAPLLVLIGGHVASNKKSILFPRNDYE